MVLRKRQYKNFSEEFFRQDFNPVSANPTKWSNKLKQFVGKLPANCLRVCLIILWARYLKGKKWVRSRSQENSWVVITWSRLAGMEFCPVLPVSRLLQDLEKWYLAITCKRFHPGKVDPSFVLSGSRFAVTKFSYVIASARLSGMKKLTHQFEKNHRSTFQ